MTKTKHTIRIISGTHRSRRLPVLDLKGLRPTGDRVRETVFNWLQMHLPGRTVLDLCAGAGALGFEAASRGAEKVVMVENQGEIFNQLKYIEQEFGFNNTEIYCRNAQDYLAQCEDKFDVVFLDPPFANNIIDTLTQQVLDKVNADGFLYREAAKHQELKNLPENWELYRQKTMGQVKIELWQYKLTEENKHA